MIVVSDTSPLNYLVLIGHVDILPTLFGRVLVPPAVMAELRQSGTPEPVRRWAGMPPVWLEIRAPASIDPDIRLGPGEVEAICLARELKADAVLIDERKAATVARHLRLFVTGTIGVLETAAAKRMISLPQAIASLCQTSFRVSQRVLEEALTRDANRQRLTARDNENDNAG